VKMSDAVIEVLAIIIGIPLGWMMYRFLRRYILDPIDTWLQRKIGVPDETPRV
jgi:hypothetical protein